MPLKDKGNKADYTKRAAKGTAIIFIGILAAAFIAYLTRVVLARTLSLEEYGLFYAVFTFVFFFFLFKNLGLDEALIKFIPEFKVKKRNQDIKSTIVTIGLIQLISSFIFIIALFILSDFLAANYFKNPSAALMLKLFSIILVLNIFDDSLKGFFQGMQKPKYYSLIEFSKNAATLILMLLFFYLGFKIYAPVWAYILAGPIVFLIFLPFFLKIFPFFKYKATFSKKLTKKLLGYSIPALFTLAGIKVISYIDVLMLTYLRSLEEVGIYGIVLPTSMLCLYLGRAVSLVMLPMSSEMWAKKEYNRLSEGIARINKYTLAIIVPAMLLLIFFSELYIKLIFGEKFLAGTLALQIILIGVIFFTIARINNSIIAGIGKPQKVTKIILLSALINIIGNLILIPKFGIEGAATATTISYIFALFLSNYELSKLTKMKMPLNNTIEIALSGIIMISAIFFLKEIIMASVLLKLFILLIIAVVVYTTMILLFKIVNPEEIKGLIRLSYKK